MVVPAHEVDMPAAVVPVDQAHDAMKGIFAVFRIIGYGFDMDVHDGMPGKLAKDFLKGNDPKPAVGVAELAAKVKLLKLGVGMLVNQPGAIAYALQTVVVTGYDHAVPGFPQVKFNFLRAQ